MHQKNNEFIVEVSGVFSHIRTYRRCTKWIYEGRYKPPHYYDIAEQIFLHKYSQPKNPEAGHFVTVTVFQIYLSNKIYSTYQKQMKKSNITYMYMYLQAMHISVKQNKKLMYNTRYTPNSHIFSLDFLHSCTTCSFGTKTQWPTDCEALNSVSKCPTCRSPNFSLVMICILTSH